MKFRYLLIVLILFGCSSNYTQVKNKKPYNAQGFALIYNELEFEKKIVSKRLDNKNIQAAHKDLKINALIKITNPKTKDSITVKNLKKANYPDFYKILISEQLAKKLNLDKKLPLVEILELRKNKSFVAKKAKIFNEEKKISNNAPVDSVQISNISDTNSKKKRKINERMYILIAAFYSKETAEFLKERITKEIPDYDTNKLMLKKSKNNEINVISGPYNTINLMKNDYIQLKNFGFEDLNIILND
tara:strand:+ start:677 stop:1414 length:738 start_codon:yes stop_codon:yes gene_type:complete